MAFYESPRFPDHIAIGATGGPEFSTTVVQSIGGQEQRTGHFLYPKHNWDISPGVRTNADFMAVRAFFLNARGRLHGWRFKDNSDYACLHTEGVVTGLTSTTFQLFKAYPSGAQTMLRKIAKPVTGTVEIRVSGSVTAATVNTVTGVVTIASAPAAADVTWSGQFDVPMRFDFDQLKATRIARDFDGHIHQFAPMPIVEVPA
jgi:uncharacterized protein (TIGR02217 family)